MSSLRYCADGGTVVGGKLPVPTDPCEYQHSQVAGTIACNQLLCGRCGKRVRHGPPGLVGSEDVRPHIAQLFEASDWAGLPFLTPQDEDYRLWACSCTAWVESGTQVVQDPDPDPMATPSFPWSCAGHPVPEDPPTVGAMRLLSPTHVEALIGEIFEGTSPYPPSPSPMDGPGEWLIRAYAYLLGLEAADLLSTGIARRVVDPNPETRGRVLLFFSRFHHAKGIETVVNRAQSRPHRVAVGYAIPESGHSLTLLDVIVARLKRRSRPKDAVDEGAAHALREALLLPLSQLSHQEIGLNAADRRARQLRAVKGGLTDSDLDTIESYRKVLAEARTDLPRKVLEDPKVARMFDEDDCRWLADHIDEIERAVPGRWEAVLALLVDRARAHADELGHFPVIAGIGILESGLVDPGRIRAFVDVKGKATDAWVLPLAIAIDNRVRAQIGPVD